MVDIDQVIKNTVKKGEVKLGKKETKQAMEKGKAKLIILAKNCPFYDEIRKISKKKNIPFYTSDSNSVDLGYTCGKSFAISVFAVIDEGGSNITNIVKK